METKNEQLNKICAKRITDALNREGLKPIELSEKTGIPRSTISHYCNGINRPTLKQAMKLSEVLKISPSAIMALDVDMGEHSIGYVDNQETLQELYEIEKANGGYRERPQQSNTKVRAAYMAKLAKLSPEHFDLISEMIDQFLSEESNSSSTQ